MEKKLIFWLFVIVVVLVLIGIIQRIIISEPVKECREYRYRIKALELVKNPFPNSYLLGCEIKNLENEEGNFMVGIGLEILDNGKIINDTMALGFSIVVPQNSTKVFASKILEPGQLIADYGCSILYAPEKCT